MMSFLKDLFTNDVFITFFILGIGYIIGSIKIKGIEIGDAGILVIALLFGLFGVKEPALIGTLGIVLFVGSVGFIAGPKFFRNFLKNAKSYVLLGFLIILTGGIATVLVIKLVGIDAPIAAGMLTGALTSTPGFSAASEAAEATGQSAGLVSAGYGVAYPFGVIGVVLFVQLLPRILKVDMDAERKAFEAANEVKIPQPRVKLIDCDPKELMQFCMALVVGVIIGKITIPLPGGASFALGTSGGPLVAGLLFGHFGHVGKVNLSVRKYELELFRELGLALFLTSAGIKGGSGFLQIYEQYGGFMFVKMFLCGVFLTLIPMFLGYLFAAKILKLNIFNCLGAICGGMTSTPALGTLIEVTKTDDVATAYASTYPIALVAIVLIAQFLVLLF